MTGFIVGLILFLGIHLVRVVAPDWRKARIAAGEGPYKGVYSLVSLAGIALMVWFFRDAAAASPVLYNPPVWMMHLNSLFMLFALVIFAVYMLPAGRLKAMLKHPMLISVKIWAFGHLLANGTLVAILLFGGFLAWAVIVRISIKRRMRAGEASDIMQPGPVSWDIAAVILRLGFYGALIMGGHLWLFGVAPIPGMG